MQTSRRKFFRSLGMGVTWITLSSSKIILSEDYPTTSCTEKSQFLSIGDDVAVCTTTYGKVRGYVLKGINHFLGIPYGADTSGENRFMPPVKPKPWSDIFQAVWYGNSAPQDLSERWKSRANNFRCHWHFDDVSENCLTIDLYTPGINDNGKRPVMVWLHGGGFYCGNAHEQEAYTGANIARFGDVVFCAPNHRLGPFGYSDLSEAGGEKYSASGNVGMLDIISALEWIHDNIVNFGGDPNNVTIIGQSGGGAKVCTATSMPSARGLINKAVSLSGASPGLFPRELSKKAGEYIVREAGLKSGDIGRLQHIPWRDYYDLAIRAAEKLVKDENLGSVLPRNIYQPNVDGNFIPQNPYYTEASPFARDIPMIICSTTNEFSPSWQNASLEAISFDGVKKALTERREVYGLSLEKAGEIVDEYAKAFPSRKPVEIWSMITTHRQRNVILADAKSKQEAPVYMAWFGWQPPLFDNRLRAFHMLDICFWFHNIDAMLSYTGGGIRPEKLADRMAGYLVQFMRTGDPNVNGLPYWPKYTSEKGELMYLDDVCKVQYDPDREARKTLPVYKVL